MKLTQILRRQHIGRMFKRHWILQGKRVPIDTGVENYLKSLNITVEEANEFVKPKNAPRECIKVVGAYEPALPLDMNHPDYKERPCYTLKSTNILLEGISQAQVLTKTVIIDGKLPSRIEELSQIPVPKAVHEGVKKAILSANVFDCEQTKLPIIKDPARPAFVFPRILGISDRRRNLIITNKLLHLVEKSSDLEVSLSKYVINNAECKTIFEKEDDLIQFQDLSHILVTSNKPLKHDVADEKQITTEIPDLYPVKHTVTLPTEHFYDEASMYPISSKITKMHPHTTWLHFNATEVGNIYETPVTHLQILGRSLTNAFSVAASYAKQLHGEDVKDLPEPIYLNCIHTDGQNFHLGVLELNTLNLDGKEGTKNVWFCKNNLKMYDSSRYLSGMPVLENYNPEVYGYISALYNL